MSKRTMLDIINATDYAVGPEPPPKERRETTRTVEELNALADNLIKAYDKVATTRGPRAYRAGGNEVFTFLRPDLAKFPPPTNMPTEELGKLGATTEYEFMIATLHDPQIESSEAHNWNGLSFNESGGQKDFTLTTPSGQIYPVDVKSNPTFIASALERRAWARNPNTLIAIPTPVAFRLYPWSQAMRAAPHTVTTGRTFSPGRGNEVSFKMRQKLNTIRDLLKKQ